MKKFLLSIFAVLFAFAGVQAQETVTDKLVATSFTATTTTYTEFSGVSFTSNAVYAGQSAKTSAGAIQLRSSGSNSGVVTTTSGGKVKKVVVEWNSSTADGRTLDIYGKNTAYSSAKDLYSSSTQGTKIGSIVCGTSTELVITGDYEYIGMRSKNNAMYLTSISVVWETAGEGVATPTFDPVSGTIFTEETLPVTISTSTEGAIIHYTINGGEEQTGSTPITVDVTETTTIVAYATLDGYENSSESTATYTKVTPISIAEARAACTANGTAVVMDLSGAQVIGVGGSNMYVQKDGVGICLYKSSPAYKLGDVFADGSFVSGSATNYGGLHELTDYTITTSGVINSAIEKNVVSFSDFTVDNSCTYITLENVTVDGSNFVSEENTLAYYDTFGYINGSTLPTTPCTVTGVLSVYNNNLQILPLEIVAGSAQLPAFSVEGGDTEDGAVEVYLNSALTITPAEGSTVTYTLGANNGIVTEKTEVLFENEGAVVLTVAVEQKFYTPVEETYYYNVVEANIPCNVSFSANGVIVGTETVNLGGSLATAPEASVPEGLELIGWTEDEETMEIIEFPYLVNSDVTLFAVYSVISEGGISWNLVENVNDINAGDEIIIAAATKDVALGKISGSYHTAVDIVREENSLTDIGTAIVLTVGKNSDNYTFSYDNKYLNWTSGNNLNTATSITNNSSWKIVITNGVATISNVGTSTRILQYNASSPRFACYTSSQQKVKIYKKTLSLVTTTSYYTLNVSAAGYATLFLDFAVAIPEDVEAYIVKEDGINDTYISLTQVTGILPAETGVIVKAAEGEYNFVASNEAAADVTGNKLLGTTVDTNIDVEAYVLGNVDGVGLYKAEMNQLDGTAWLNNAYKAYLPASAVPAAEGVASFSFRFEGDTTGIDEITDNRVQSTEIYDLTGRRVENITAPGIYIINGVKRIVR